MVRENPVQASNLMDSGTRSSVSFPYIWFGLELLQVRPGLGVNCLNLLPQRVLAAHKDESGKGFLSSGHHGNCVSNLDEIFGRDNRRSRGHHAQLRSATRVPRSLSPKTATLC